MVASFFFLFTRTDISSSSSLENSIKGDNFILCDESGVAKNRQFPACVTYLKKKNV
jgi:hypothetical protein